MVSKGERMRVPGLRCALVAAICAVGDDVNDIAMIRAAGLGVAMGNAQPAVKAAADVIAMPVRAQDRSWVELVFVQIVEDLLRLEARVNL